MVRELARLGAPRAAVDPAAVELMKPRSHERPFSREGWLFELKYDGFRLLAAGGAGAALLSLKRGRDATGTFPEIAGALAALPFHSLVLDGEIVVLDAEGRPSFQGLQNRIAGKRTAGAAVLFAFDLLACEGFDLRPLPLGERKALLDRALAGPPGVIRPTVCVPERGEQLYAAVREMGLEGIVGKRLESPYQGGYSPDWLKVRGDRTADFAVVGFEPVPRARDGFRNLHLAVRNPSGGWDYVGPVGGGLTGRDVAAIYPRLDAGRRAKPVTPLPAGASGAAIVPVEPEVVVEVRYREITEAGRLRLPTFLRLRDDKTAAECHLPGEEPGEEPGAEPEAPPPAAAPPPRREAPALRVSHPEKILWPGEGITKTDLLDYYRAVSPWMLPFLAGRPLVMERFPHGVGDLSFIQKSAPQGLSRRLRTVAIPAEDGRTHDYVLCDDVEGLLELVNLATIPFHVWSSRAGGLDRPDWCILDLDPKDAPFGHVVAIARALRELCGEIELPLPRQDERRQRHARPAPHRRAARPRPEPPARRAAGAGGGLPPAGDRHHRPLAPGPGGEGLRRRGAERPRPAPRGALRRPSPPRRPRLHAARLGRGRRLPGARRLQPADRPRPPRRPRGRSAAADPRRAAGPRPQPSPAERPPGPLRRRLGHAA